MKRLKKIHNGDKFTEVVIMNAHSNIYSNNIIVQCFTGSYIFLIASTISLELDD